MMVIGLTGGIASGKSTLAEMLKANHIPVIDADDLAREAVLPHTQTLAEIVQIFGAEVLQGQVLDRAKLAQMVFSDPKKLSQLEAILHPEIGRLFKKQVAQLEEAAHPIVVYMAPLIFEKNLQKNFFKTILVLTPSELRKQRLMMRDNLSSTEASKRMALQLSDEEKISLADFVINNNGNKDELYKNLSNIWIKITKKPLNLNIINQQQ